MRNPRMYRYLWRKWWQAPEGSLRERMWERLARRFG